PRRSIAAKLIEQVEPRLARSPVLKFSLPERVLEQGTPRRRSPVAVEKGVDRPLRTRGDLQADENRLVVMPHGGMADQISKDRRDLRGPMSFAEQHDG